MNTHVQYVVAKMLKEKGFDQPCSHHYVLDYHCFKSYFAPIKNLLPYDIENDNVFQFSIRDKEQPHLAGAPTIAQVVDWLHNKHHIWVNVSPDLKRKYPKWSYSIWHHSEDEVHQSHYEGKFTHSSPNEAYHHAILLILKSML